VASASDASGAISLLLYVNRLADDDEIVDAFDAFGDVARLLSPPSSHTASSFSLLSVAAARLRRRLLLTAASIRLMLGRYYNIDGFLDAARPNDQEASQARRVPAS
jgi:hypothetical protein